MSLLRRRALMVPQTGQSNIAYEASNLTFNGNNYVDTGLYLFSAENVNKDFELIATGVNCPNPGFASTNTILCAKLDGPAYGFLVRPTGTTDSTYAGTIRIQYNYDVTIIIRRINGVLSLDGDGITNQPVPFNPNNVFDQPLVLGCALQANGTPYRYASGNIDHIIVTWL